MTRDASTPQPSGGPDEHGHFGTFGGRYVPETLMPALAELTVEYEAARNDPEFQRELDGLLRDYVGRPSPLTLAGRLSEEVGAPVYLKREDLNHTGAHKINAVLAQGLLAKRMGKQRIIAETGAGQHGVATATVCALLGFECIVYMGAEDMRRQALNVFRMKVLGAEVRTVDAGSRTLKNATSEAIRDWVTNVGDTYYIIGQRRRPAPLSDAGTRVPARHRRRSARPAPPKPRAASRRWRWPASAAARTRSGCSIRSSTTRRA